MIADVVVTGAGGMIGRELCKALARKAEKVTAVSRQEVSLPGCDGRVADLRSPDSLHGLLRPGTVVFHLAGRTSVAGSVHDPWGDFEHNVAATVQVLNASVAVGARVILASSAAVFQPGQPLPLSETALKRPTSPYGAAKLSCENYAQAFHASRGLDVRVARLFNVYGPNMRKFAIVDFFRKLQANPHSLEILGDGEQLRDYLYIDDTISALMAVAERGVPGQDYNIASGQPTRLVDLAKLVADVMGLSDVRLTVTRKSFPGDIPQWYADIHRIRGLGFEAQVPLREGLVRTIEGLRRHEFDQPAPGSR